MKQKIWLTFLILCYFPVFYGQSNKDFASQVQMNKRVGGNKIQKYNVSPGISVDENRDMTQALKHLKRRYGRNYTFKHSRGKSLERDDFGYMPLRSKHK